MGYDEQLDLLSGALEAHDLLKRKYEILKKELELRTESTHYHAFREQEKRTVFIQKKFDEAMNIICATQEGHTQWNAKEIYLKNQELLIKVEVLESEAVPHINSFTFGFIMCACCVFVWTFI